jgi:hypothetical protein
MGGEPLRGVGSDPLRSPVQRWERMAVHACVRACCLLVSHILYLVSSLAPCLVRSDRERPDAVVRVRASSPLEGSRPSRWWGRDSGPGTMQVPLWCPVLHRDCAFVVSCSDTLSRISLQVRIVRIT